MAPIIPLLLQREILPTSSAVRVSSGAYRIDDSEQEVVILFRFVAREYRSVRVRHGYFAPESS